MATYYAVKSGNINATDVWATTPGGSASAVTFSSGDVLVANSYTITVNVSTNLGSGTVTNDNRGGATQGGSYSLSNGVTLTANVLAGASNTDCVSTAGTVSATIVGNVTAGGGAGDGCGHGSSGQLTVTGSISGGSGTGAVGVTVGGTGSLVVTGDVTGGSGNTTPGILSTAGGSITITGTLTGGTGGSSHAVTSSGAHTVTVTGTVLSGSGSQGISQASTGTLTISGTCVGAALAGVAQTSTGTVTVTRAKGGPLASSAVGLAASSTGTANVEEIEFGDAGASPTSGPIRLTSKTSNVAVFYVPSASKKTLVDTASTSLLPAASDVRFGTTYNSGATTGTCRVPSAANVLQGVLVDNTTGTALMTPADFWGYATSSATTSGSMGERLKSCATVASTGQQIADAGV